MLYTYRRLDSLIMPTELREKHLHRTQLTSTKFKDALTQFGHWLAEAQFEIADRNKSENLRTCNDPGLNKACQPLLMELGIYDKVTSFD